MSGRTVFDRNPSLFQPSGRAGWARSFAPVLADLRRDLRAREPAQIARRAGVDWSAEQQEFTFDLLNEHCRIGWPDLVAYRDGATGPLSTNLQGMLLYYLSLADGSAPAEEWISFRELPDGWLYHQAFQGYSGDVLARELVQRHRRVCRGRSGARRRAAEHGRLCVWLHLPATRQAGSGLLVRR